MAHKEFQSAGKEPGLQVWRLEKMDLKPVPPAGHGAFYQGDAYIVLFTSEDRDHSIHMWLGSECSADERGASAIFAFQLDDFLGGGPRQYREVQSNESNAFLRYFPQGLRYKEGGMASGLSHVETNDMTKQTLLHLKGKRLIRAQEVPMTWSSFNNNDCFVIDLGQNIYQWCGSKCNRYERLKSTIVAIGIRDDERGGRPDLHMIEEGSEPEEVIQADLLLNECYILDHQAAKKLFVWKGPTANMAERKAAFNAAQQFITQKNYPTHTQVEVLASGGESTLFKQFFFDWRDKYECKGPGKTYTLGSVAKVQQVPFDASTLHANRAMAAQHGMVDDGSGEVKIWRVEESDKVEVEPSTYGQFFGGDCYLILYSYNSAKKHIIYMWQGLKSSTSERAISACLAIALDDSMGGSPVQVRVIQGYEPAHLVSLFKAKPLMLFLGGTSRGKVQSQPGTTRLFHIRRSSTGATRAVEVQPTADRLNTNDVLVLKCPGGVSMWRGRGSTQEEAAAAKYVADYLGGGLVEVKEGDEPACFWSALGGKKDYQTSKSLQTALRSPRLFVCSNKTGNLIAEELPPTFTQLDLAPDDIMLLDTWDQIFLWIGEEANEVEKKGAPKIAADYVASANSCRGDIPVISVKQGFEPPTFTGWFQAWDPDMAEKVLANFH
ncbi:hypothetical protein NHX12_033556 [Muraenolepis orangiensis]|uniref:Gelsolin-like domain-containing protein n=1 Tax=Muraenolepis orangiensis TaxID=630683 RepID=A0A9Q0E682_9TELE|nr:hypothetical protein NHX12_033556 [Muraenolepis orangiensis]